MDMKNAVPRHVAIIMDGNGRWASKRGLPKVMGHRAGVKSVAQVMEGAIESGVEYLTLYTFSTENWRRPKEEVGALFGLIEEYVDRESAKLVSNGIRLTVVGRREGLPDAVCSKLDAAIEATKLNTKLCLNLALNYGGRAEIVDAVRAIAQDAVDGRIHPSVIDEALIGRYLYTKDMPDPELMIRTSGEYRISNFLLWQLSYAEFYVTDKLWPDFTKEDFVEAVHEYQRRERRLGGR